MATIGQYLSLITNAVYGEEVRSAIVNAIQQCYTDATDVVKVSETEPTSENTRIWIKPTTDECKVPTWEEHEALDGEVSDLKSALNNAKTIFNTPDPMTVPFSSVAAAVDPATGGNGTVGGRSGYVSFNKPICIDYSEEGFLYCVWVYETNTTTAASYSPTDKKYISGKTIINPVDGANPCFRVGLHRTNGGAITSADATTEFGRFVVTTQTDKTLSKEGAPADAKTVGDTVDEISQKLSELDGFTYEDGRNLISDYPDTPQITKEITWNCQNGVFTVSGSTTSIWFVNLAGGVDSFPAGIKPGDKIKLYSDALVGTNVFIGFRPWKNGVAMPAKQYNNNQEYIVPADATGFIIRIEVPANRTLSDTVVYKPTVRVVDNNAGLSSRIAKFEGSEWAGKIWYCYGTSMSDTEISKTGKWPLTFEQLSGMEHHNFGIGSGGICPSLTHHGNVKAAIMNCPWDVDLVTLEVGANDFGQIDLGDIGDESDDTYAGNFTQCLKKLTLETRAKVVAILIPQRSYTTPEQTVRQNPHRVFQSSNISKPYSYRDALDLEVELCKMYGVEVIDISACIPLGWRNKVTLVDQIHNTNAGGLLYGTFIWNQIKNMMPCNVSFTQADIGEVW